MLSAINRFHGHGSLRYVYKNGQAVRSHLMTIKFIGNPHRTHSRFSVVVSKKVYKRAVGRNRIRRRVYEIIRTELPHFSKKNVDMVLIIASSEVMTLPADELRQTLVQQLRQTGVYKT